MSDEPKNWWTRLAIQTRRAVGVYLDLAFAWLICLLPWVVHGFLRGISLGRGINGLIESPFSDGGWVLLLSLSPFPLICLRLMCKLVLKSPTPGEMISGVVATSSGSLVVRLFQNFAFALWQHTSVILSVLCLFAPALMTLLSLRPYLGDAYQLFGSLWFLSVFSLLLVPALSWFYRPHNSAQLESRVDTFIGLKVAEDHALSPCLPAAPQ